MKRILLFAFLIITAIAKAQIVNIPDATFKARLLQSNSLMDIAKDSNGNMVKIDTNNDGHIQVSEAQNIHELKLWTTYPNFSIYSLTGIEAFTNLRKLNCGRLYLTSLDVTALSYLQELYCNQNDLTSLEVHGLANLKILAPYENNLTYINFSGLSSLEELDMDTNRFVTIDLTGLPTLKKVDLNNHYLWLTAVNVTGLTNLEWLNVRTNPITALDVSTLTSLKWLNCGGTNVSEIDLAPLTQLEYLNCNNTDLTSINLTGLTKLKEADLLHNQLTSFTSGSLPELHSIFLSHFLLESVDLSGCTALTTLSINSGNNLKHLNVKNGPLAFQNFSVSNSGGLWYICVDEPEISFFTNYFTSGVNINSYCEYAPGGNSNLAFGKLIVDADDNGCTAADHGAFYERLAINDGTTSGIAMTNYSGAYRIFAGAGTYTLTPQLDNSSWFTVSPPFATVNFPNLNNSESLNNFCISGVGVHKDVEVLIIPLGTAQPGFDSRYKIIYKNKGNQPLSGTITLHYDESVLDFFIASDNPVVSPGTITWTYSNLRAFKAGSCTFILNLNGPMETPPLNLDDVITFTATMTPITGDETPADNTFTLNSVVVGAFDPNDITCLEGKTVHPNKIGEYLHYNINFENTGNAPATFVVVKDVINTQQFDMASFRLIESSHNIETRIIGNKIEFYLDDINLQAGGKGNIVFKVKTLPTLAVNSSVKQKADIYFDYNWPIATNDANTTFAVLSAGDFAKDASVKVYPNPAKNLINISADSTIQSLQLYDVQGRLLQAQSFDATDVTVDVSGRQAGIYFIKIITDKGSKVEKVIKE